MKHAKISIWEPLILNEGFNGQGWHGMVAFILNIVELNAVPSLSDIKQTHL